MHKAPLIILASRSPARRELMKELGFPFKCHASEIFEDMNARKDPAELAMYLASQKAQHIAAKYANAIIIGVDTFVTIGKEKIGKPENVKDAEKILRRMSGKKIQVISGIAVLKTNSAKKIVRELISHAVTTLTMVKIPAKEIRSHASRPQSLEVAGGITIEKDGDLISKIDGDYNNVVGLPLMQLKEMLEEMGISRP